MRQFVPFAAAIILLGIAAPAQAQFLRGRVLMPDKSPAQHAAIERVCPPAAPIHEVYTSKHGEYILRGFNERAMRIRSRMKEPCVLRARMAGYLSGSIDLEDPRNFRDPELPNLVMHAVDPNAPVQQEVILPKNAVKPWNLGVKALNENQWTEAERLLREVTRAAPEFALGWSGLGFVYQNLKKTAEARDAFQHAIKADPKALLARVQLARVEVAAKLWAEAAKTSEGLIEADKEHKYLEAYLEHGLACYMLRDFDRARASLSEAVRLDPQHQAPMSEYLLGLALAAKGDREAAVETLRKYIVHAPFSPNADKVQAQIASLSRPAAPAAGAAPQPIEPALTAAEIAPPEPAPDAIKLDGRTFVPGGRKALAAVAGLQGVPPPETFLLEYCRKIAAETSTLAERTTPGYIAGVKAYLSAASLLADLTERREGRSVITLSLADPVARRQTEKILSLLGWRVVQQNGATAVEPGDQAYDGPRQQILPALGIEEMAMREALQAGRTFPLEFESEYVALAGGSAWGVTLQEFPSLSAGMVEAFARNTHLATTYAGLAGMGMDTAMALVKRTGLPALVSVHSALLGQYGDIFRVAAGKALVPGGAEAEDLWGKLAGASPRDPAAFFDALLKNDRGRLVAFFAALTEADAAHQRYFTHDAERARTFYTWFRDAARRPPILRDLPFDENGAVRFPGGRAAWSTAPSDMEAFFPKRRMGNLVIVNAPTPVDFEALLAIARLERERGRPLNQESAKLVARNFAEWQSLFPYFATLGSLGAAEFQALETLTAGLSVPPITAPPNGALGEWHSLVALIAMGKKAGSLDDATAARAFTAACRAAAAKDHSVRALAALREIAGGTAGLDEAVMGNLLKLDGPRRRAFERVRELQRAPRLDEAGGSGNPERVLLALSGAVYGAVLDPDALLVSEDARLLAKHVFVSRAEKAPLLFQPSTLAASNTGAGSRFTGGFAEFASVAHKLAGGGSIAAPAVAAEASAANSFGGPAAAAAADPSLPTLFRVSGRLVEVHAIVTDDKGRYVDDLAADRFVVRDGGLAMEIRAFENRTASLSCALLLDTSLSMESALPPLKSAALKLIAALRPDDSVAIYSLSGGFSELQAFTKDKSAATRAVLRAGLGGTTALYDALVRVNRDLEARTGKKVIVVFTDGEDNASTLTAETAIRRAKTTGVPLYTIAQGHALRQQALLKELSGMSQSTGGLAFTIQFAEQIGGVFESILQDLLHGYLLAFQPLASDEHAWRPIAVSLRQGGNRKIRAREGYFPE